MLDEVVFGNTIIRKRLKPIYEIAEIASRLSNIDFNQERFNNILLWFGGNIMEMKNLLDVKSREELRTWLEENHKVESECWVIANRGKPKSDDEFIYLDIVEEAMCFGWIDSTAKKIEEGVFAQRISPRRKNSSWTQLNKERCRRLEKKGLMTDAGRAILPDISIEAFEIDEDIMRRIKEDPVVWDNFNKLPELYKRIRIDTIQAYKKQKDVYERRLKKFIDKTRAGAIYGDWNDNGRLLDD